MNIIKAGKLPEEKQYQTTCDRCKTIFTFKQKEAEYVSDQRDGDFLKVKCPFNGCNTYNFVNPNPQRYDWYDDRRSK